MCSAFRGQARSRALRHSGLTLLALLVTASPASAQRDLWPVGPPALDPAKAIADLANGINSGAILSAFRRDRPETELREGNYVRYTDAQRQQLLDGLERVARGELRTNEAEPRKPGRKASLILLKMLHDPAIDPAAAAEIPRRLLRIYDQALDLSSKGSALHDLAYALAQSPPEAPEIVARFIAVASGPGPPGALPPATAVRALQQACHAGLAVLRRLAEEDLIREQPLAWHVERLPEVLTLEMMESRRGARACPEPGGE